MPKFSPEEVKALSTHALEKALDAARTKYFDMDDSDPAALKIAKDIFKMFDAEMFRRESLYIHENPADADPPPIDDDNEMAKIINSPEKVAPGKTTPLLDSMDRHSEKYPSFARIASSFFPDPSSTLLMARRKGKNPRMVVPNSLQRYHVHSAHDNSAPDSRQRVFACPDDFCWEFRDLRRALTLMCPFSKWIEVFPLAQDTAFNTTKCLAPPKCLTRFILEHRIVPEIIPCDRGRHYTGAIFAETCFQLGIKLNLHVSWRPESTGCQERANRSLKNSPFILTLERNSNWVDILPYVVSALNSCMNRPTKTTPSYCLYGLHGNIDLPMAPSNQKTALSPLEYGLSVPNALKHAYNAVQITNKDADDVFERKVDQTASKCTLEVGQKVCLYCPQASGNTHHMPWSGECKILETNDLVSKITNENGWTDWVHNLQLRRIFDRPDDFEIIEPPKFMVHQIPVTPVLQSGGGKSVLPKPSTSQLIASPPTVLLPQAPSAPKPNKKLAKTARRHRKPTRLFISNVLLIRHYLSPALPLSYFISSARKMPSVPSPTSTRAHPGHILTYLSDNPTDLAPAAYSIQMFIRNLPLLQSLSAHCLPIYSLQLRIRAFKGYLLHYNSYGNSSPYLARCDTTCPRLMLWIIRFN